MRVRFAADALANPNAWPFLDIIVFKFFGCGRHRWDVNNPGAVRRSQWLAADTKNHWTRRNLEFLQKTVTRQAQEPPRHLAHTLRLTVSVAESPPDSLAPEEAERVLGLPVYVVVENAESDRAFLDAMIRAFGRTVLRGALDRGWCEIVGAGGSGEIKKRVKELLDKVKKGPRRILVLKDSDRLLPEGPSEDRRVSKAGDEYRDIHDVSIAILRKREIENYLPDDALGRIHADKLPALRAFRRLRPDQRDHYDMKYGFKRDPKHGDPILPPEQEELFRDVDPRDLRALCGGFGENVWKLFEESPTDVVNETTLRALCRDDPDEIARILDAIEKLL